MKLKIKITPFLILSVLAIVYSLRNHLFDFWTLTGGTSLIGVFAIAALGISVILFVIDRQLLKKIDLKKVYLIELITIVLIGILYLNQKAQLICELNDDVEYFVIVYEVEGQPKLTNSFPFNKRIKIEKNGIYLTIDKDKFSNGANIIRVDLKSHSSKIYNMKINGKTYRTDFMTINNSGMQFDSVEFRIDSLIRTTYK